MSSFSPLDFSPLHLDWPDCRNARDLGGTPTTTGAAVRERALIRTDGQERLNTEGIAAIRAYGTSRIVDLRRPAECEEMPNPFDGEDLYHQISVHPETSFEGTLEGIYCDMLDRRPDLFARALGLIASAPDGPVIVHCVAGKDRTGLLVALALHLAGVSDEVVAADYAVTDERLQKTYAEYLSLADPGDHTRLRSLYRCPPAAMLGVLRHLRTTYGSVERYVEKGGLTPSELTDLRSRLLD